MSVRTPVLDHGYVELIEHWGSDERIIEAARMSTNKGFQGWGSTCSCVGAPDPTRAKCPECGGRTYGDEKLLSFLYTHKHLTPFEMAGMAIEIQAPIFVFREWHRHRTQSYNELSARYTPLPDVNYVPTFERVMLADSKNKQAQGTGTALTEEEAKGWITGLEQNYAWAETRYQSALRSGIPKELARLCIPVGRYSRMRASANLRNWLGFLTLRMDKAAQWEIRQYANAVGEIVSSFFPRTWTLFSEGRP